MKLITTIHGVPKSVTPINKIVSLIYCFIFSASIAFSQFEMRDASYEQKPHYVEKEYIFEGSKQKIYVDNSVLIDSKAIDDAYPIISGSSTYNGKTTNMYGVEIILTKSGAETMARISESRVKKPLAILINGKVVSVAIVAQRLSGGRIRVSCDSEDDAIMMADKIMAARSSLKDYSNSAK